jgi:hypothetical protein
MSSACNYSDINLDAYEQLILMIKSLTFIVAKYPIGNYMSNKIGELEMSYTVNPVPYCRAAWAKKYNVPFNGSLEQAFTLQDIYLSLNIDYNIDPLVIKLLTYYKKI